MVATVERIKSVRKVSLHVEYERVLISRQEVDVKEGLFKVDDLAIFIAASSVIPIWLIEKYDIECIKRYALSYNARERVNNIPVVIPLIPCQVFTPRWRFVDDKGTEHVVQEWQDVSSILGIE